MKRETPVVPCPTQTALPTRRMSKHQRAKLYNIYLRPWTLNNKLDDEDVLFAGDFGLPTQDSVGTVGQQWKDYIPKIWPHALRTVRNFMAISLAESQKDDPENDCQHGPTMIYAMSMTEVEGVIAAERKNVLSTTVKESTDIAMTLCRMQRTTSSFHDARQGLALNHQSRLKKSHLVQTEKVEHGIREAQFETVQRDWSVIAEAYDTWCQAAYLDTSSKVPTAKQREILLTVHLRRKYEYFLEQGLTLSADIAYLSSTPLYRLIHGLPGAGKSQVLLWLRSYFEEVWHWKHRDQFVFLTSMNSMADNIGGFTMHSYFAISFMGPRCQRINSGA